MPLSARNGLSWARTTAAVGALILVALVVPGRVEAQLRSINPTGGTVDPTTGLLIHLGDTGQIQILRGGTGQVFSPMLVPPSASMFNGIFLAAGPAGSATVYGSPASPSDTARDVTWTAGGQTPVSGTGTRADPFAVTTTLTGGGFEVRWTVRYTVPDDEMLSDLEVVPPAGNTQELRLYHIIDTFLAGSDAGPAYVRPSAADPAVVGVRRDAMPPGLPNDVFEAFIRVSDPWDRFYSGNFNTPLSTEIDNGGDLSNTIDLSSSTDNGIGVQWTLGVLTAPRTIRYRLSFTDRFCTVGAGALDPGCIAGLPACSAASLTCVECTADRHCSGGRVCDVERSTCQTCLDSAGGGAIDSGCTAAAPLCDTSGGVNRCAGCVTNADCSGGTPVCDAAMCRPCAIATQTTDCPSVAAPICATAGTSAGRCIPSTGLGVCYLGGPSAPGWIMNGSASIDMGQIEVTPNTNSQSGSVFYESQLSTAGDLRALFTVDISTTDGTGADGMAFVMQRAPAGAMSVGTAGEGIGYQGLTPSVIIEFDTFRNTLDPDDNHVAIMTGGRPDLHVVGPVTLPFDIHNAVVNIWVDYTAAADRLDVYMSRDGVRPAVPTLTGTVDFATVLGPSFFVGLTASTGGFRSRHAISRLVMTDSAVADSDSDGVFDTCDGDDDNDCLGDASDPAPTTGTTPALGVRCPMPALPICTVLASDPTRGTCVQCVVDGDCAASATCDTASNTCIPGMLPDGGLPDAGELDAGVPDADGGLDAGDEFDAGGDVDGGERLDAGVEADAGDRLDAGTERDMGVSPMDGGVRPVINLTGDGLGSCSASRRSGGGGHAVMMLAGLLGLLAARRRRR